MPNPLRSGDFMLSHASYAGDVGNVIASDQPVLTLEHHAQANVTVEGLGDPIGVSADAHSATFDVIGKDTLNLSLGGGRFSPFGPGIATVDLKPGARLTGSVTTNLDGFLTINGGHGTRLVNYSGTLDAGQANIQPDIAGNGTISLLPGGEGFGGSLNLGGAVSKGETIKVVAGNLLVGKPMQFLGAIDWAPGGFPGTSATLEGITADSFSISGGELHLFSGAHDFLDVHLSQEPGTPLHVLQNSQGVVLSFLGPEWLHDGSVELPLHTG